MSHTVQEFTEAMDIEQTKLVLGFKSQTKITNNLFAAASVMGTLYGGSAYSKLFTNVREKMGLCYYAASAMDKRKNILIADCGIEKSDILKAKNAIIKELDDIKNNLFTNDELENAKKTLVTSCNSVVDTPNGLESWYLTGFITGREVSPKEEAELIKNVTREDVVKIANYFTLDTVYVLTGGGEDE
jgi:predicted Zn-dependent peptidase